MCRRRSSRVDQRNEPVLGRVQALKADHPFWSYRRLWTQLHFEEGLHVNKKRVLQLMRDTTLVSARKVIGAIRGCLKEMGQSRG